MSTPVPDPRPKHVPRCKSVAASRATNHWEGYSEKLRRDVHNYSDLTHDHCILIEGNPDVDSFCERPVADSAWIDGRLINFEIDCWIRWRRGAEEYRVIRKEADLRRRKPGNRLDLEIRAQEIWAERNALNLRPLTDAIVRAHPKLIQNWTQIMHFLRVYRSFPLAKEEQELAESIFSTLGEVTFAALVVKLTHSLNRDRSCLAIFRALHSGMLSANLQDQRIGPSLVIKSL